MDEDKKYLHNDGAEEEEPKEHKTYYPHQENWELQAHINSNQEQEAQEEQDFLEYLAAAVPSEAADQTREAACEEAEAEAAAPDQMMIPYEQQSQEAVGYSDEMYGEVHHYEAKKQKAGWGKRLAIVFGSLVAVALIAFSSIGI